MNFIMNKQHLDICAQVLNNNMYKPDIWTFKVRWWNLGYTGNPWPLDWSQTIEINQNDYNENWINISHLVNKPRTKPGVPT